MKLTCASCGVSGESGMNYGSTDLAECNPCCFGRFAYDWELKKYHAPEEISKATRDDLEFLATKLKQENAIMRSIIKSIHSMSLLPTETEREPD